MVLVRLDAREWTAHVDKSETVSFGLLLRQYRLAAGLTQEELAERAHLSARGISDLERGARSSPRRDTLLLLADALQLSAEQRARFEARAKAARPAAATPKSLEGGPDSDHRHTGEGMAPDLSETQAPGVRVDEIGIPRARRGRSLYRLPRLAMAALIGGLILAAAALIGLVGQSVFLVNSGTSRGLAAGSAFAPWGPRRSAGDIAPLHLTNALRVAVAPSGAVYVTEGSAQYSQTGLASHRADILKLSSTGQILARWGRYGKRPGEFNEPAGIAADSSGNVYVAEVGNNRVVKLTDG